MASKSIIYALLFSLFVASSCEDTLCTSVFTSEFKVEYFNIVYSETDSETVEQPLVNFTKVFALGNEDSLFYSEQSLKEITLAIDPDEDFTTFVIETLDSISIEDSVQIFSDTLSVRYVRRQRLISEDCGPEQLYIDFEIVQSTYDSINLFQDQLKTINDRFIEIFY